MRTIPKLIVALATLAPFTGTVNGAVQAASASQVVQVPGPKVISGELQSVDVDDMSFVVKLPNASVETILYNEQTVVMGADKGAAGLATMHDLPVTVYFKMDGNAKIATRIEIDPAAQQG